MSAKRPCTKDDPRVPWRCSCDDCSRAAAHAWIDYVQSDRFQVGVIPPEFGVPLSEEQPEKPNA